MKLSNIIVTGDLHNEFDQLNTLIANRIHYGLEMVICCGDFGFWPKVKWAKPMEFIKPKNVKVLWCDGNHENHWQLKLRESDEIVKNVIYMPRGSHITLSDGRNVLFMGGADSIDKDARMLGIDWFPDEVISMSDMVDLPDINIDIVISHTCPYELTDKMLEYNPYKIGDPSTHALQIILEKYKPKLWYFGHWHVNKTFYLQYTDTVFYALNDVPNTFWWRWLPEKGAEHNGIDKTRAIDG
jgi:Icc-related predicted phosphoesterase